MSKEMRNHINKFKYFTLNESCEDGNCIPFNQPPEGKWKKQMQQSKDAYDEYLRKIGNVDVELFDELYDNMSNKTFFGFKNEDLWYDEDNYQVNKNEMEILKIYPVIDTISSWKEWVNSIWFETSYLGFSKKSTRDPITIYKDNDESKGLTIGEEPMRNKKKYFEHYLERYGPLLVKKIISNDASI